MDEWPLEPLFTNNSFTYSSTTEDSTNYFSVYSPVEGDSMGTMGNELTVNPEYLWKIL
jgi:hypothetical protein